MKRFEFFCYLSVAATCTGGVFLEDDLPLQVDFLPSSTSAHNPDHLSDTEPITLVFSRPVISFGSDVHEHQDYIITPQSETNIPLNPFHFEVQNSGKITGTVRWVTTYIARFDPIGNYPRSLNFSVSLNTRMSTYDGISLRPIDETHYFTTSDLSATIKIVESEEALELTDGLWSPVEISRSDWECPPNAKVTISFRNPVNKQTVTDVLYIEPKNSNDRGTMEGVSWTTDPSAGSDTELVIYPSGLHVDKSYRIIIPAGYQYHEDYGIQTSRISLTSLQGLHRFVFPFDVQGSCDRGKGHQVFDLWLLHGLSENTTLEDIERVTSIWQGNQQISFLMERPNLGTLRITCDLAPGIITLIRFNPEDGPENSVEDGFGLPLEFTLTEFFTSEYPSFFEQPNPSDSSFILLDKSAQSHKILSRGGDSDGQHRKWSEINPVESIDTTTEIMESSHESRVEFRERDNQVQQGLDWRGFAVLRNKIPSTEDICDQENAPNECVTKAMFLVSNHDFDSVDHILTAVTDLQISYIANHHDSLLTWVTRMSTGEPVPNAEVILLRLNTTTSTEVHVITRKVLITDEEGLVEFDVSDRHSLAINVRRSVYHLYAQFENDRTFLPEVEFAQTLSERDINIQFITDRTLYSPGDTIYLKGYVRETDAGVLVVPSQNGELTIALHHGRLRMNAGAISWDRTYGSFSQEIAIPEDATLGDGEVELTFSYHNSNREVSQSKDILISTPRAPTAELSFVSLDNIYALGRNMITLQATTTSYTGTAVEGSLVEVSYTIDFVGTVETCEESEEEIVFETFTMTTEEGGIVSMEFTVEGYELSEGDVIEFDAQWIDATGALLQDIMEISVAVSEFSLDIETSINDVFPGLNFGLYISAFDFAGNPLLGEDVNVVLLENVHDEFDELIDHIQIAVCEAVTDNYVSIQCDFLIPETKQYTISASFQDDYGETVLSELVVGRTADSWAKQPLYRFDGLNMKLDKEEYEYRATVVVSFDNPFSSAWFLLRWGDELANRHRTAYVEGTGRQEVNFHLGNECIGRCDLVVSVSVGRQDQLPQNFPISALFDLGAARLITRHFVISVPYEDRSLDVGVSAPHRSRPGEQVDITINVDTENEAEISVFVVEKVYLDLEPNPILNFDDAFVEYALGDFLSKANIDHFVSAEGFQQTIDKFLDRLEIDPWITPEWKISPRPGAEVDLDEETYWERLINEITDFPSFDFDYLRTLFCEEAKLKLLELTDKKEHLEMSGEKEPEYSRKEPNPSVNELLEKLENAGAPELLQRVCCECGSGRDGRDGESDESAGDGGDGGDGRDGGDGGDGGGGGDYIGGGGGGNYMDGGDGGDSDDDYPSDASYSDDIIIIISGDGDAAFGPPGGVGVTVETGEREFEITSGPAFEPRTAFEITPLFVGEKIVRPGDSVITLDLPDNVGTFNIRAYAVDDRSRFGVAETEIVVTKPITMQSSQPRFARIGDEAEVGVTVTADMANFVGDVSVSFELESPADDQGEQSAQDVDFAELQGASELTEELTGAAPVEVSFPVVFTGIGEPLFTFTAVTNGGVDAMQTPLEIIEVMDTIDVATSFSLIASDEGTFWEEEVVLPQTYSDLRFGSQENRNGRMRTRAKVAHLEAVRDGAEKIYAYFIQNEAYASLHGQLLHERNRAELFLGVVAALSALDGYPLQPDEPEPIDIRTRLDGIQRSSIRSLRSLTNVTFGLISDDADLQHMTESQMRFPWGYIDYKLNAYGLYIDTRSGNIISSELTNIWRTRLETSLVYIAQSTLCTGFSRWGVLSLTFAALGINWTPPDHAFETLDIDLDGEIARDIRYELSVENARIHVGRMNDLDGSMFLYALYSSDETFDVYPTEALDDIFDNFVIQGETAHISGYNVDESSVTLSAIAHTPPDYSEYVVVEKLVNWIVEQNQVLNNDQTDPVELSHELFGLMDYDVARTSHDPNLLHSIISGEEIASNLFTFASQGYYEEIVPWDNFTVNGELVAPLELTARGNGEVSVHLALEFIPPIYTFPVYRGFFVERFCQRFDPETKAGIGEPLVTIEEGEVVQITVQISSPDRLPNVEILDYVPAGLEPLDPELFEIDNDDDPIGWYFNHYTDFRSPELAVDRVTWHSNGHIQGTYTVTYHAISVTPGIFIWPQARAFVKTQPEVMGMSGGGYFIVTKEHVPPDEVGDLFDFLNVPFTGASFEPQECGEDCGKMACDLSVGECVQYDNFIQ